MSAAFVFYQTKDADKSRKLLALSYLMDSSFTEAQNLFSFFEK